MFSKNKPEGGDAAPAKPGTPPAPPKTPPSSSGGKSAAPAAPATPAAPKAKPAPSTLSSDLIVTGHMKTTGDIQIEGTVEGDVQAHLLTVGENATVKGEIIADDVVVTGRVIGRVRGLKVRLRPAERRRRDKKVHVRGLRHSQ